MLGSTSNVCYDAVVVSFVAECPIACFLVAVIVIVVADVSAGMFMTDVIIVVIVVSILSRTLVVVVCVIHSVVVWIVIVVDLVVLVVLDVFVALVKLSFEQRLVAFGFAAALAYKLLYCKQLDHCNHLGSTGVCVEPY